MTERGQRITLQGEDGAEHELTLVDVLEVEGRQYAVLQPDDPGAGAVLFHVDGETLTPVDDPAEFERVVQALRDLDEYDELVVAEGDVH